jgi:hypothetical protein
LVDKGSSQTLKTEVPISQPTIPPASSTSTSVDVEAELKQTVIVAVTSTISVASSQPGVAPQMEVAPDLDAIVDIVSSLDDNPAHEQGDVLHVQPAAKRPKI